MSRKVLQLLLVLLVLSPFFYLLNLPDTKKLQTENPKNTAIREFREKQIHKNKQKPRSLMTWRSLDQISPHLQHAVVLSEDDTFFQHNGFDIAQLKRAARINWERKRFAFGGSTLTQQLARTLYLSSRKSLLRKAKEALIARRLEKTLTKKRILELYLNVVEWGPQVYGAEAASRYFYSKAAIDLTPEEAISLAAILPSPRRWNPRSEKHHMVKRKSTLYERLVRANYIRPAVSSGAAVSSDEPTTEGTELSSDEGLDDTEDATEDELTSVANEQEEEENQESSVGLDALPDTSASNEDENILRTEDPQSNIEAK